MTTNASVEAPRPSLPRTSPPRIHIGGVAIDAVSLEGAIDAIEALVAARQGGTVFTPNVDHIVQCTEDTRLREAYDAVSLSLVDGMPVYWAARLLGRPLPAKVSGSDLVLPLMERAARRGWRVYFLGGADGAAQAAKDRLERDMPGIRIVGLSAPRIRLDAPPDEWASIVASVRETNPDLVLVALGAPKQEIWSQAARAALAPSVLVGVGASLDFIAGIVHRAPSWISSVGLEWVYRLAQEPRRLWRRYLLRDPKFAAILVREVAARMRETPRH
jgi:N-acetylglucosaminyldiphosphoundecaprenol N-acetyl-beta-D-mannosaminyltransferase